MFTTYDVQGSVICEYCTSGVAIGNGFVDPENMLNFGDLLFQIGLADGTERDYLKNQTLLIQQAIQEKRWRDAFTIEDRLMDGDIYPYPTYFYNITGSRYYYNFLQSAEPPSFGNYLSYLNQCYVRNAIHVGNQIFDGGNKVEKYLLEDIFQTAKQYLVPLLENYRVLLYNGQLDLICALPFTENYLNLLQWNGGENYRKAEKFLWRVAEQDVEPAGYVRHSDNFYQVAVRKGNLLQRDRCTRTKYHTFFHATSALSSLGFLGNFLRNENIFFNPLLCKFQILNFKIQN